MNIGLVDNFDSFTYNLVHLLESFDDIQVKVFRNDNLEHIDRGAYEAWVISPGPGLPEQAGGLMSFLRHVLPLRPILGVCLGHQALIREAGGSLFPVKELRHGVSRPCRVIDRQDPLFKNLPELFDSGRYHSWVVSPKDFPDQYAITGIDEYDQIMSVRHQHRPVWGIQFHPESVLTPWGKTLIGNWLHEVYLCSESKPPCRS